MMVLLGFLAAGLLMQRDFARKGAPGELAWWIVAAGMLGGLAGARIHLALTHWDDFARAPLAFLFAPAGLVWYGGLLGGVLATWIPIRAFRVPWLRAADTAAPALALGLAFGRIGCHLAGDGDWGVPTSLPWGVAYANGIAPWPHAPGVRVHPAPLYEAALLFALAAWLWHVRTRIAPDGTLFFLYLGLAGVIRFGVEWVRTNPAVALGLTEAQWTSLALMALSAAWLHQRARR
jgi:phosphatidylglycerol:prolipoprotein diacylglycerol transferase